MLSFSFSNGVPVAFIYICLCYCTVLANHNPLPPQPSPTDIGSFCILETVGEQRVTPPLHFTTRAHHGPRVPVVLIPGYSASFLRNKYIPAANVSSCPSVSSWSRLWFDDFMLVPPPLRSARWTHCYYARFGLSLNASSGAASPLLPGSEVEPVECPSEGPRAGNLCSCDYVLYEAGLGVEPIFGDLAKQMQAAGYRPGFDLLAAPWDWRHSRLQLAQLGAAATFRRRVEGLRLARGLKVRILAHSLGNLFFHWVAAGGGDLSPAATASWLRENVDSFVSVAAPWGGSVKTVKDLVAGSNIIGSNWYERTFDIFDRHDVRRLGQGFGSLTWLLPAAAVFGAFPIAVFNHTGSGRSRTIYNASTASLCSLFEAADSPSTVTLLQLGSALQNRDMLPPGAAVGHSVRTFPLYSVGVPTVRHLTWVNASSAKAEDLPNAFCGDGDGEVPIESLAVSLWWSRSDAFNASVAAPRLIPGATHSGILSDARFLQIVIEDVLLLPPT